MRGWKRAASAIACSWLAVPLCFAPPPLVTGDVPTAAKGAFELYFGIGYQDSDGIERQLPFSELVYGLTDRWEVMVESSLSSIAGEHGLGDTVIGTKVVALVEDEARPGVAISYELNLPTGRESRGLGSGAYDHQIRLRVQKAFGWFVPIGNLGYTFADDVEFSGGGAQRRDWWRASFAQEWRIHAQTTLLSEIIYRGSITPAGEHRLAANIGLKYRMSKSWTVHGAVGRSLRGDARGGPDFRSYVGLKWEFPAPWKN